MNVPISDAIHEALTMVSKKEWQQFFDSLATQELNKIATSPSDQLTTIQTRVILIQELDHFFSTARNQP